MTKGVPLSEQEKEYIVTNSETKFPRQIAEELGRHVHTVRNFLRESD